MSKIRNSGRWIKEGGLVNCIQILLIENGIHYLFWGATKIQKLKAGLRPKKKLRPLRIEKIQIPKPFDIAVVLQFTVPKKEQY